ncbi:hypothetical protein [Bosea thiooxidans]
MNRTLTAACLAATALGALSAPSLAETRKLRVANSFPAGHYLVKLIIQPWMAEVTKRTNGGITFDYFPSQQIGKAADMLKPTQSGVVDIGYVAPAYVSDKMVASEVAMLPGGFTTACRARRPISKPRATGSSRQRIMRPTRSSCSSRSRCRPIRS